MLTINGKEGLWIIWEWRHSLEKIINGCYEGKKDTWDRKSVWEKKSLEHPTVPIRSWPYHTQGVHAATDVGQSCWLTHKWHSAWAGTFSTFYMYELMESSWTTPKGGRATLVLILLLFKKFIYFNGRLITLQYCDGFAIHWHESAMGTCVPILNPPPTSLPIPCLWVVPEHQLWVPCFMHWTFTGHLFYIW